MDLKKAKRLLVIFFAVLLVMAIGIYVIAFDQFRYSAAVGEEPTAAYLIGEIVDGTEICQTLRAPGDYISSVAFYVETYNRENSGALSISLERDGLVLAQKTVDISDFKSYQYADIPFDPWIPVNPGETLTLRLSTDGCVLGTSISLFAASEPAQAGEGGLQVNGAAAAGTLCAKLSGYRAISFYQDYWGYIAAIFLLLISITVHWWKLLRQGKPNPLDLVFSLYFRYSFLLKQLVSRDFKTKYKRSALGMLWSFVNPLLTMLVQYVVFSTAFKGNIQNFPVYLLTGTVFFNFFNEAVSLGMTSIAGNAALIKKVYVPKYIYPISRILSSGVNFLCSFIPLLLIMAVTGTPFRPSLFLLIYDVGCLFMFITGITLLLTTAMTFFQDTQFLWSVASMMWMYLTPLFYPETIIPKEYLSIYRLNPMYQYITFARTCIMEGISPGPQTYGLCLLFGVLALALGIAVFKRHQSKFVLYL